MKITCETRLQGEARAALHPAVAHPLTHKKPAGLQVAGFNVQHAMCDLRLLFEAGAVKAKVDMTLCNP